MKVVISQPMFFPWIGIFEQVRLCDVYIHYDDVQFPKGRSLMNRVKLRTNNGDNWLTMPVKRTSNQMINQVLIDNKQNWKEKHLKTLYLNYKKAPYYNDMVSIINSLYEIDFSLLAGFNITAIEVISDYFGFKPLFIRSSDFKVKSSSSERLINLVKKVKGDIYITGHGALNYLNHELFEKNNIRIEYMDYLRLSYHQMSGDFNPHLSILDLIANLGKDGIDIIQSNSEYWKEFFNIAR